MLWCQFAKEKLLESGLMAATALILAIKKIRCCNRQLDEDKELSRAKRSYVPMCRLQLP